MQSDASHKLMDMRHDHSKQFSVHVNAVSSENNCSVSVQCFEAHSRHISEYAIHRRVHVLVSTLRT